MTYWLDLFTGQTWQEFQSHGAKVSGFRKRMHNAVERIKPGDILLCYLTGVKRWVGALTVNGRSKDKSAIWEFDPFPERLNVTPTKLSSQRDIRKFSMRYSLLDRKWVSKFGSQEMIGQRHGKALRSVVCRIWSPCYPLSSMKQPIEQSN